MGIEFYLLEFLEYNIAPERYFNSSGRAYFRPSDCDLLGALETSGFGIVDVVRGLSVSLSQGLRAQGAQSGVDAILQVVRFVARPPQIKRFQI